MSRFSVSEPLNMVLVRAFDRLATTAFEMNELSNDSSCELAIDEVHSSLRRVGVRLLGDDGLYDEVMNCLGDGPARGDALGALLILQRRGDVELSNSVLYQIGSEHPGARHLPYPVWDVRLA